MQREMFEQAPDSAAPGTLRWLLAGPEGLRAGWSLLLFALLVYLLGQAVSPIVRHLHLLDPDAAHARQVTPAVSFWGDALNFGLFALAALAMSIIERRPFGAYGLRARRLLPDFAAGLLTGLTLLSALVATLWATHALVFDAQALHGAAALASAARWAGVFLAVGLFEEFATRGYLQFTLARGVAGILQAVQPHVPPPRTAGFWIAASFLSVGLFTYGHLNNPGETLWGIAAVGVAGVLFAYSLWWTGSLWWAVGLHTAWDWAQTCLYGTPDSGLRAVGHLFTTHPAGPAWLSGGSTGPEGSILVLPTLALAAVLVRLTTSGVRPTPPRSNTHPDPHTGSALN